MIPSRKYWSPSIILTSIVLVASCLSLYSQPPTQEAAETPPPAVGIAVLRQDPVEATVQGDALMMTVVEVTLQPLSGSPPHRHPGPVSGYVLEGEFEFQVEGMPLRILKAGDSFFEPTMVLHLVGRNPNSDGTTRVLANILHPANATSIMIMEEPMEQVPQVDSKAHPKKNSKDNQP